MKLSVDLNVVKGFMDPEEGLALYESARSVAAIGPCLEIGSYCGKSTLYLGAACQETQNSLYAIDHHRGSEEHQVGEAYHDAELYDSETGLFDSFTVFRSNIKAAQLEDTVIPIVAASQVAGRHWQTPLGLVFIDGGHSSQAATIDYEVWSPWVAPGGLLLIHDIFPDPKDGGRPPFEIYQAALASGGFELLRMVKTLGILRRRTNP
ncbi:MAG: putative O-methyltransferase YrrM [Candidatus Azotimanducaceae bacterium]|jgi:predicted O-methyltransferase YrrM|tara:strand:+ start:7078 stop:7698 length:621 start_codon:yes stop_codon:yes gene_type:complete